MNKQEGENMQEVNYDEKATNEEDKYNKEGNMKTKVNKVRMMKKTDQDRREEL